MKTLAIIIAVAVAAFAGCIDDDPVNHDTVAATTVPLIDPCKGDEIGTKDLSTGEYRFDNGSFVDSASITKVDVALDVCQLQGADQTQCWKMTESGSGYSVGCSGCCTNHGGGTYSCWESCHDYSW